MRNADCVRARFAADGCIVVGGAPPALIRIKMPRTPARAARTRHPHRTGRRKFAAGTLTSRVARPIIAATYGIGENAAVSRPVIITCALTGGAPWTGKNPAVPVTPQQIAESGVEAARAGAAIVHIHVRDPETGQPSMRTELYRETVARIRDSGVDVVINLTTGPGARFVPGDDDPRVGGPGT